MTTQEGFTSLASGILEEARRQEQTILEEAEAWANETVAKAKQEAVVRRPAILAEGEKEATATRRQIVSAARVEAKRKVMASREELISRVLSLAKSRLQDPWPASERERVLRDRIREAATNLGGGDLIVQVNQADQPLLTAQILRGIEGDLRKAGVETRLTVNDEPAKIWGGAIVSGREGKVVCDNSFEARLARLSDPLRVRIWELLSEKPTTVDTGGEIWTADKAP